MAEQANNQVPRQASLAECNRQMIGAIRNERKVVTMKGPDGIIKVPLKMVDGLRKDGYQVIEEVPSEQKTDGGEKKTGNDDPVKYQYNFKEYTAEELLGLAEKAGLAKNVKKPETILAKLTEMNFNPDGGSEE
jgi:hypothetical protein